MNGNANIETGLPLGKFPPAASDATTWRHQLSEELRTRLNAIIGFAELLGLDPLPANARSDVRQILNAARDVLAIINRELTPSVVESAITGATSHTQKKASCDLLYIEDDIASITLVERILELRPGVKFQHAAHGQL